MVDRIPPSRIFTRMLEIDVAKETEWAPKPVSQGMDSAPIRRLLTDYKLDRRPGRHSVPLSVTQMLLGKPVHSAARPAIIIGQPHIQAMEYLEASKTARSVAEGLMHAGFPRISVGRLTDDLLENLTGGYYHIAPYSDDLVKLAYRGEQGKLCVEVMAHPHVLSRVTGLRR